MVLQIKIVPDDEPNADGKWFAIDLEKFPEMTSWRQIENYLSPHVPQGFHVVSVHKLCEPAA